VRGDDRRIHRRLSGTVGDRLSRGDASAEVEARTDAERSVTIALTVIAVFGVAWLAYRVAMIIAEAIVIAELVEHGFRKRDTSNLAKPSCFAIRRAWQNVARNVRASD
jgi:hypothetical protein